MHALAGFARQPHQPLRADQRRLRIPPHRMRPRVALHAQMLALAQAVFVLGMEGGAAADGFETACARSSSSSTSSEPVDEPMNTFTPPQPGSRSSSGKLRVFSWVPPT